MTKLFILLGSAFGLLSVGLGAFGAHALRARVEPRMLEVWETATEYQMYHALALLFVAWLSKQVDSTAVTVAGVSFAVGILLFSGSLYALVLTNLRAFGPITPIGGVVFMIGWVALMVASTKLA